MSSQSPRRRAAFGPGILVTAAFIGPGTIATASSAGASYGFALLWALLFSVVATIVLQEMAARQALVTRAGLAENLRSAFHSRFIGRAAIVLVVAAIGCGNAAYEAGNLSGAALALASVSTVPGSTWSLVIGAVAGGLLLSGHYRILERVLIALVLLMSIIFLLCAWLVAPPLAELAGGFLRPSLPAGSLLTVVALIGTTVVPYNLFLQANAVREKWSADVPLQRALRESRWDTGLAIGLGGLVTLAILSTAAMTFYVNGAAFNAFAMSEQLRPLLGDASGPVFAAGLFAGGLTSAITAPLAAGYAVCGALGWRGGMRDLPFRAVCLTVLLTGTLFSAIGTQPLVAILFAQAANGLLLPFVAVALLILMNRRDLLGEHVNGRVGNLLGAVVVGIAMLLGAVKLAGSAGAL